MKFIHCADLHLDSPMVGLKELPSQIFKRLQDSTFEALTKIVDAAIVQGVDFVVLAGDLFDGEDRSIRAQIKFRNEMERLVERDIPVYIVHGNHDHLGGSWAQFSLPNHVHIFSDKVDVKRFDKKDGTSVHLYGFSYPRRHVYERIIDHYKKKQDADFHIGILHGNVEGNTEHGKYAPFTVKELIEKDFDYWALGHIHKRQILQTNPPIIYSGNTQGRNRKETGEKGCFLIQLTQDGADIQFIETSSVIWKEKLLDATEATSFQDIYELCKNAINEEREVNKGIILSLSIDHIEIPHQELSMILNGDLLDALQEEEKEEAEFVWLAKIIINEKWRWDHEQLARESDFYAELFQTALEFKNTDDCITALYHHPDAKKLLQKLDEDEREELVHEAENLLVQLLVKDRG